MLENVFLSPTSDHFLLPPIILKCLHHIDFFCLISFLNCITATQRATMMCLSTCSVQDRLPLTACTLLANSLTLHLEFPEESLTCPALNPQAACQVPAAGRPRPLQEMCLLCSFQQRRMQQGPVLTLKCLDAAWTPTCPTAGQHLFYIHGCPQ